MIEPILVHPVSGKPLPDHVTLVGELRRLRERGLLRLRELELPALERIAVDVTGSSDGGPRALEKLLRQAAARLGDDEFGLAAQYLFGLVQGTFGRRPTDLREAAADQFGLAAETFRKNQERRIVDRLADEILTLAVDPVLLDADQGHPGPGQPTTDVSGLPSVTVHFTGRAAESSALSRLLSGNTRPLVCVLHGLPGVGKTALAVRAAHHLAGSFPDGPLFLDLTGHSGQAPPQTAAEVADRLLRRLGVPGELIPRHLDDRAAVLTRELSHRRGLIVLDDAVHADQVLPVLRAAGGCSVLITSRARLSGLDEAHHLHLGVLPRPASVELFARVFARSGVSSVFEQIAERCGDLPLALRIAAARAQLDPRGDLLDLLRGLKDETERLFELDDGTRSVAAAFAVSSSSLPPQIRRQFFLLAGHPGPDLPIDAAGALIGESAARTRRVLDTLVERNLVEAPEPGRYRFHDLLADFGRDRAQAELSATERREATARLADWYLAALEAADRRLTPHRHRIDLPPPPHNTPHMDDFASAVAWVTREEANIVAVTSAALEHGLERTCWQLAYLLRGYLYLAKAWSAWHRTHSAALTATRRLGDRDAEATTLNNLGLAELEQGRLDTADRHYERAQALFVQTGNRHGEHTAMANRSWVAYAQGRYEDFLTDLGAAMEFYEASGAERNAAISLRGLTLGQIALGRPQQAIQLLQRSLIAFERLELPLDTLIALNNLAGAHRAAGDLPAAREVADQALAAARACGTAFEEARALTLLGDLAGAQDDLETARLRWEQARKLYQGLGAAEAVAVSERLEAAVGAGPTE